jgi:hypothetical protein
MMKISLSWICYWIGDLISHTIMPFFGRWFEWPHKIYSRLMHWSVDLQSDDRRGPWRCDGDQSEIGS